MFFIMRSWRHAFSMLHPNYLRSLLKKSSLIFFKSCAQFFGNFLWLIALDAFFLFSFGDIIAKTSTHISGGKTITGGLFIITFVQGVIWLILSSTLLLLLRKNDNLDVKEYCKIHFLRYIKLSFLISIISLVILYILVSLKITKFPSMTWKGMLAVRIFEFCIIFYWLDSSTNIVDFFRAIEKAANIVFYNTPFFVAIFALFLISDYCLCKIATPLFEQTMPHLLLTNGNIASLGNQQALFAKFKYLALKYGVFMYENFLISILFCFYRRTKHNQYSISFFK